MHPIFSEDLSIAALALGNFVFVMRADQVLSSCVDINLLSQIFFRHDRTLDMPSGASLTPG